MRHEVVRGGAVPMPLARRGVDRVARLDLEQLTATSLYPPDSLDHVQGLAHRVGVPGVARARRKVHDAYADARWRRATGEEINPHVADEGDWGSLWRWFLGQKFHV